MVSESEPTEPPIPEHELRTDIYTAGVFRVDNPGSYPAVRVTHIPTGLVVDVQDEPSQTRARAKAVAQIKARIAEADGV